MTYRIESGDRCTQAIVAYAERAYFAVIKKEAEASFKMMHAAVLIYTRSNTVAIP